MEKDPFLSKFGKKLSDLQSEVQLRTPKLVPRERNHITEAINKGKVNPFQKFPQNKTMFSTFIESDKKLPQLTPKQNCQLLRDLN